MSAKRIGTAKIYGEKWPMYKTDRINDQYCGYCELDKKRIFIAGNLDKKTYQITILHEILHALWLRMGYKQSGLPHELEEVMIDQIATCIFENKDVLFKVKKEVHHAPLPKKSRRLDKE